MSASLKAITILVFCFFHFSESILAQHNSAYYDDYTSQITGRFYFSQEYTSLVIDNKDERFIKSLPLF